MTNHIFTKNQSAASDRRISFMEDLKSYSFTEIISIIILVLFVAGGIYFGIKYFAVMAQADALSSEKETGLKITNFENLFIDKVLRAQGEVSYEDRLKLENAVADIGDADITAQWHKFLASKTEAEAQHSVLNLLSIFAEKVPGQ